MGYQPVNGLLNSVEKLDAVPCQALVPSVPPLPDYLNLLPDLSDSVLGVSHPIDAQDVPVVKGFAVSSVEAVNVNPVFSRNFLDGSSAYAGEDTPASTGMFNSFLTGLARSVNQLRLFRLRARRSCESNLEDPSAPPMPKAFLDEFVVAESYDPSAPPLPKELMPDDCLAKSCPEPSAPPLMEGEDVQIIDPEPLFWDDFWGWDQGTRVKGIEKPKSTFRKRIEYLMKAGLFIADSAHFPDFKKLLFQTEFSDIPVQPLSQEPLPDLSDTDLIQVIDMLNRQVVGLFAGLQTVSQSMERVMMYYNNLTGAIFEVRDVFTSLLQEWVGIIDVMSETSPEDMNALFESFKARKELELALVDQFKADPALYRDMFKSGSIRHLPELAQVELSLSRLQKPLEMLSLEVQDLQDYMESFSFSDVLRCIDQSLGKLENVLPKPLRKSLLELSGMAFGMTQGVFGRLSHMQGDIGGVLDKRRINV